MNGRGLTEDEDDNLCLPREERSTLRNNRIGCQRILGHEEEETHSYNFLILNGGRKERKKGTK